AAAVVSRTLGWLPWPQEPPPGESGQSGGEIAVGLAADLPAEGYRLRVEPDQVTITAGGEAGVFYAVQTLRQLLPDQAWRSAPVPGPAWTVPCAEIEDAPVLGWRGAHLDVARHFFPKREVLALIDALAALKINRLHLHLTDDQGWRIESHRYPALQEIASHRAHTRISVNTEEPKVYEQVPHGGYYTLADLAEISSYAAQRMVTLVPEIEVPGHATALLAALPGLGAGQPPAGGYQVSGDWGIFPYLMTPLSGTLDFLGEIFGELLAAVPARFVHIGGDECVLDSWRADPAVTARQRALGLGSAEALHARFLREVADLLADSFGARSLVWDEGFGSAAAGGEGAGLRPDTIVMAWRGMDIALRAALAGHEVIAAPVFPTYFDYYQADDAAEPAAIGGPVTVQDVAGLQLPDPGWPDAAAARLAGAQFQVWTEYIRDARQLEYMIFPRACALAEVTWAGGPAGWAGAAGPGSAAAPLRERVAGHLDRLDAAGVEYRPLDGPRPWQRGGDGQRRHRQGYRMREVTAHLDQLAAEPGQSAT
ncbi:MAG TPA: family 20 glycosylhydrolase, partial [Streptosporangiaceae bacterium]